MTNLKKYLYIINYPKPEKELCLIEMKYLFKDKFFNKILFTEEKINPSISPFVRFRLEILFADENIEKICKNLKDKGETSEDYKVEYIKFEEETIPHEERLNTIKALGLSILGTCKMTKPKNLFGIIKINNIYYFGKLLKNDFMWDTHVKKPCSYSNSLSTKLARVIVNLASEGNKTKKIIDPCCGIGTTIIEGKYLGLNIIGSDINPKVVQGANMNLEHFGFQPEIETKDLNSIEGEYDASILDIPYGIFSHTNEDEQNNLIKSLRRISKKMILISFEDLSSLIIKNNFEIKDICPVTKGKFKRYIYICE
ncbi:tRNA G10 N-methylase Trm11 [Cetobacterium ceti]|uniref:tRNA G10 N-methylase Trm11 n=1 Tax=Cetobacterium ceti TaxID=180163 RepID=A0A1T4PGU1_9FUSO|nr:DNA methyltransferase [Cetobacterium ceti]SJZ90719.1 tRNA G10 N-methylase Trm11 [Cetobacterium ceti]